MDINDKKETGTLGEEIAAGYLKENDFKILAINYRTARGEIDIIARKGGFIVFVEVKTRTSDVFGSPGESIGFGKVDRIRRAAIIYLKEKAPVEKLDIRFDVLSINIDKNTIADLIKKGIKDRDLATMHKSFSRIEHIMDAF